MLENSYFQLESVTRDLRFRLIFRYTLQSQLHSRLPVVCGVLALLSGFLNAADRSEQVIIIGRECL